MAIALVRGIAFQKDDEGLWEPRRGHATSMAWDILTEFAEALGFQQRFHYLETLAKNSDDIRRRIVALEKKLC